MKRYPSQVLLCSLTVLFSYLPFLHSASTTKQIRQIAIPLSQELLKTPPPLHQAVAVMPFENTEEKITQLGQLISKEISKQLAQSKKVTLVERQDLNEIYEEWKLNLTGAVNAPTTQKIGEMTGAHYLVVGTIEKISPKEMMVFTKLIETQTAEILDSASLAAEVNDEMLLLNQPIRSDDLREEPAISLSKKGSNNCIWIQSSGLVPLGQNDSKNQARARAIVKARQKAMSKALGEQITQEFSNFGGPIFQEHTELLDHVLLLTRYGRILEETIIEEKLMDSTDCTDCLYQVVLQNCIAPQKNTADKGFRVSLNLNRIEFWVGDQAEVLIHTSRDAYIYLFSVDKDWNQFLAFPNTVAKENFVKTNTLFMYPNAEHKKAGIHLVAELPEDQYFSAETFRVLATKKSIPESLLKGKYNQILENLNQTEIDWAESADAFIIRKK
jgi:TolB-like protein